MKKIGSGSFSTVYRPEGQTHVIKRPRLDMSPRERQRMHDKYTRQKILLDYLHEKNPTKSGLFNQIYDVNQNNQLIMKDLGDTDLFAVIQQHHPALFRDRENVFRQLIDAVRTLFQTGIVHRDIKTENIMIGYDGRHFKIALVDFTDSLSRCEIEDHLQKFSIAGTYNYMSPWLLDRHMRKDKRKGDWEEYMSHDLWALGAVLYMVLYGVHPYTEYRRKYGPSKSLSQFHEGLRDVRVWDSLFPNKKSISPEHMHIVKSLLSVDPHQRIRWLQGRQEKNSGIQMLLRAAQQQQKQQRKKK